MDSLLPNTDQLNQTVFSPDAQNATSLTVDNGSRFQVGDLVRPGDSREVMLVTVVASNTLTVVRGYGGTTKHTLANDMKLYILGNAALEGDTATPARFTSRSRKQNFTQIFAATVDVSGSMQAARPYGISDEVDYQKQERLRELLRDLENCVINGAAPATGQVGSSTTRRSMNGVVRSIQTNVFVPNAGGIPPGGGAGLNELNESVLNAALRLVWEQSSGRVDTIVVGGSQKRRINQFVSTNRRFGPDDTKLTDMVSVYESDFGVCRVILSRWMSADTLLLLDSSRVEVLPLSSRSFHFRPLASTGDSFLGQVIGEYTVEMRNESAHGLLRGLAV